jgi:hypothetical protein
MGGGDVWKVAFMKGSLSLAQNSCLERIILYSFEKEDWQ